MFQILDPHEDVCSEEGEQCNDYSRLRRLDISCVFKCIDCCCKVSLIRNVINATFTMSCNVLNELCMMLPAGVHNVCLQTYTGL